ncbi:uncharacterized protein METZ01_LOCUS254665, partial [marine metagenome]
IDGVDVTSTPAELNIMDGSETVQGSVVLEAGDGVVISDGDVMKQALVSDFATYISSNIADGTVVKADIEDIGANSILARNANSAGVLTEIVLATTQILIGDGDGFTAAALSGDATMTNGGAVTIANDAVTLAKMADIAQGSIIVGGGSNAPTAYNAKTAGQILVGDNTDLLSVAVSGDATLAASGALTIAANAVSLAKMAGITRGSIIIGDSGGDPAELVAKTDTQILVGNGDDLASVAVSGDATLANNGALTIAANAVQTGMVHDDVATELAGDGITATSGVLAVTPAQTTITSVKNNSLVIGGNSQNNTIDFGTDDEILFDIDNTEVMKVVAAGLDVTGTLVASGNVTGVVFVP